MKRLSLLCIGVLICLSGCQKEQLKIEGSHEWDFQAYNAAKGSILSFSITESRRTNENFEDVQTHHIRSHSYPVSVSRPEESMFDKGTATLSVSEEKGWIIVLPQVQTTFAMPLDLSEATLLANVQEIDGRHVFAIGYNKNDTDEFDVIYSAKLELNRGKRVEPDDLVNVAKALCQSLLFTKIIWY